MRFNGICIVTQNVPRLCAFYREILKLEPEEGDVFKIIPTEGAVLSIFSSEHMEEMARGSLKGAGSGSYTIEFEVEDVDQEFERLQAMNVEIVKPPTTQPWDAGPFGFATQIGISSISMPMWRFKDE